MTPEDLRAASGLSVAALSRRADVDRSVIDRIERGDDVSAASIDAVAAALGVEAADLMAAWQRVRAARSAS